jgi:hypothetical protein
MADIQVFPSCVALLGDLVGSREADRPSAHAAVLRAIEEANAKVPQLDVLRVTVGDELQGVYATLGGAFAASFLLRNALAGRVDVRFGFGGGEVRVVDAERGIQDGSAWLLARQAIESAEARSREAGYGGIRTAVTDARPVASPFAEPVSQLVDAHLHRLKEGPRATLTALLADIDNQAAASQLGISPSANSQRIVNNDLRPLAAAIRALQSLP